MGCGLWAGPFHIFSVAPCIQTANTLSCAQLCLSYVRTGQGECNAFSYNDQSQLCELASLPFLEDPLEDGSDGGEKKMMVDVVAAESLREGVDEWNFPFNYLAIFYII